VLDYSARAFRKDGHVNVLVSDDFHCEQMNDFLETLTRFGKEEKVQMKVVDSFQA
jgi:hypothetical protein